MEVSSIKYKSITLATLSFQLAIDLTKYKKRYSDGFYEHTPGMSTYKYIYIEFPLRVWLVLTSTLECQMRFD
jgi:hypothetical protein